MKNLSQIPHLMDLHFHSTLSDGCKTSEEIITLAKERGIGLIINTDHDIVNQETPRLARQAGIMSFE